MTRKRADLIVVGYGAAGAAAALRAAELGASVILLEKQLPDAHTPSTRMSGGHVMGVSEVSSATRYLDSCSGGMIPIAVSRAWADRALHLVDWLDDQGTRLHLTRAYGAEHPHLPGASSIHVYMQGLQRDGTRQDFSALSSSSEAQGTSRPRHDNVRTGIDMFASIDQVVRRTHNVSVHFGSPAQRLTLNSDGRVDGVVYRDNGGELKEVRSEHGVVLTCGGYEYDDELKRNYLKSDYIHFYGNPGNTGDGIRMAQAVGADLWHMNQMVGRAVAHFENEDGTPQNFSLRIAGEDVGYVITDKFGRRFMNEYDQAIGRHDVYYRLLAFDPDSRDYPRIPSYWFFDGRRMATQLLQPTMGYPAVGLYDWSEDNSREVEQGWILEADTIAGVAAAAGLADPQQAEQTVEAYNHGCVTGAADPFGRPRETLHPLEGPPFYCVPLYPGGSNTSGGPRRNESAQILDPFGDPIPGLFSAGELGQAIGMLYPAGGCNLSEAMCFGQIAAESALGH